ncbi:hypothetical protein HBB16_20440 [Pseudonocardia sp. MCCB 268]|nr:hypothetical protein [Pseudonocardia cytotoxica]
MHTHVDRPDRRSSRAQRAFSAATIHGRRGVVVPRLRAQAGHPGDGLLRSRVHRHCAPRNNIICRWRSPRPPPVTRRRRGGRLPGRQLRRRARQRLPGQGPEGLLTDSGWTPVTWRALGFPCSPFHYCIKGGQRTVGPMNTPIVIGENDPAPATSTQ